MKMNKRIAWITLWLSLLSFMIVTCSSDKSTSSDPPFTSWMSLSEFDRAVFAEIQNNRYPAEIQSRSIDDEIEYRALFADFSAPFAFFAYTSLTAAQFESKNETLPLSGFLLQDVEQLAFSNTTLFNAVWIATNGLTSKALNPSPGQESAAAAAAISAGTTGLSSACSDVADSVGGILVQVDDTECVIMESSDKAECRSTNTYANCVNFTDAKTTCTGGTASGADPYLPSATELEWMYEQAGTGSPVSNNNFCVDNSGACTVSTGFPTHYWSSNTLTGSQSFAINFATGESIGKSNSDTLSVRCVMRLTP